MQTRLRIWFLSAVANTVVLEFIQPPLEKFCVFVLEKTDTISDSILKHYSYFIFLQCNTLLSELFRPFLGLGQCSYCSNHSQKVNKLSVCLNFTSDATFKLPFSGLQLIPGVLRFN